MTSVNSAFKSKLEKLKSIDSSKLCRFEKLGTGTYGTVYKAWSSELEEWVAIKTFKKDINIDEILILNQFNDSKNIINFLGITELRGKIAIVMELCVCDLYSLLYKENIKEMNLDDMMSVLKSVIDGLWELHDKGIAHHDIKTENIFLSEINNLSFEIKLGDFGLSRTAPTIENIGTPLYMAPEVKNKIKVSYCPADIYAFGCLILELSLKLNNDYKTDDYLTEVYYERNKIEDYANKISNTFLRNLFIDCVAEDPKIRPTADNIINRISFWYLGKSQCVETCVNINKEPLTIGHTNSYTDPYTDPYADSYINKEPLTIGHTNSYTDPYADSYAEFCVNIRKPRTAEYRSGRNIQETYCQNETGKSSYFSYFSLSNPIDAFIVPIVMHID